MAPRSEKFLKDLLSIEGQVQFIPSTESQQAFLTREMESWKNWEPTSDLVEEDVLFSFTPNVEGTTSTSFMDATSLEDGASASRQADGSTASVSQLESLFATAANSSTTHTSSISGYCFTPWQCDCFYNRLCLIHFK